MFSCLYCRRRSLIDNGLTMVFGQFWLIKWRLLTSLSNLIPSNIIRHWLLDRIPITQKLETLLDRWRVHCETMHLEISWGYFELMLFDVFQCCIGMLLSNYLIRKSKILSFCFLFQVNIYLSSLDTETVEEIKRYPTVWSYLGALGGAISVYLGASLLNIFEILELVIRLFAWIIKVPFTRGCSKT